MNEKKAIRFQSLSKLKRSELETSYEIVQNENIQLKKALHQQFSETNRLRCQLIEVLSFLNCQKILRPSVPINEKENGLQLYVQLLNEKISILTHQLLNHSRFHTEVHKCYRGTAQSIYPFSVCSDEKKYFNKDVTDLLGENTTNSSHVKQTHLQYPEEDADYINTNDDINEFDTNNEEIRVADNIDIIRLKILIKRLTVQNAALSHHVDSADKEVVALRKELNELRAEFEKASKQISKEKEKYTSAQTLIVELTSLRQKNKMLLEEIREIQEEKEALKGANQKLLEELNDINEKINVNNSLNKST